MYILWCYQVKNRKFLRIGIPSPLHQATPPRHASPKYHASPNYSRFSERTSSMPTTYNAHDSGERSLWRSDCISSLYTWCTCTVLSKSKGSSSFSTLATLRIEVGIPRATLCDSYSKTSTYSCSRRAWIYVFSSRRRTRRADPDADSLRYDPHAHHLDMHCISYCSVGKKCFHRWKERLSSLAST